MEIHLHDEYIIAQPLPDKIQLNLDYRNKKGLRLQSDWLCRFGKVKAILQLKKSLNLGDVTEHFKTVASKQLL
jgi:hypothetical protein